MKSNNKCINNLKILTIQEPHSLMELEKIEPYDYLESIPQLSYYWDKPIIVTTSFFNGFGTFTWDIPENTFDKVPEGTVWDRWKIENYEKIDEPFQIQFLCETKDNFPYKDPELKKSMKDTFYDQPWESIKVNHIQFKVNQDSLLSAEVLLWSLIHKMCWTLLSLRKDFITEPSKKTRIQNGWL